jgi:hypothetical protein
MDFLKLAIFFGLLIFLNGVCGDDDYADQYDYDDAEKPKELGKYGTNILTMNFLV